MAGGQYNYRRDNSLADHAAAEGRWGGRNCGIPSQQGGAVMRVLARRAAENFVRKLEQRGAADLGRVETQVKRIVNEVREKGDRSLRRYAEKFDGLGQRQP